VTAVEPYTPLVCNRCGVSVAICACPDMDQRLRECCDHEHVAFKWCLSCNRHYARCRCKEPLFGVRTGGKTMNAVFQ